MITPVEHLQVQYELSMAIGRSLDLKNMLRRSISTILRKLNCQAGIVLELKHITPKQMCFTKVFSIPRDVGRIEEYQDFLDTIPEKFQYDWLDRFIAGLPSYYQADLGQHIYILDLPDFGLLVLLKNEQKLEPLLVKSFAPLLSKLATACKACVQNNELLQHRDNLQQLVTLRTSELVERNVQLEKEIAEKEKAEKGLRESEERYAAVVQQALEGIYLLDPETKEVLHSNQALQNMLGYSSEEMKSIKVYDLIHHDRQDIDDNIDAVPQLEHIFIGERKYVHKSGSIVHVDISAKFIKFSGKQSILVIVRDISERKRAEEEKEQLKEKLRQAQKFEALGTLAGGVAHDLNNILSGIVGYPELLLTKIPEESELVEPLKAILDSGQRASVVVADLLTVARSAASIRETHNLNTLIKEYYSSPEFQSMTSSYPDVSQLISLKAEEPFVPCSPVHIKKVIMNLVTNATEAIEGAGEVEIRTYNRNIDPTESEFSELDDGMYLVVEVCDTGSGISEKDHQHIFDPFYTKKEMGRSGTGLGLTVVWNTVVNHGGKITVESSEEGTCFKLFFPCSSRDQMVAVVENQPMESFITQSKERILVVDDEQLLQDIASHMLYELGYSVETVSSGEAAVEWVRKHPVDLLVIDMLMEPGMNGKETYEKIHEIQPSAKAVITSGFSESEDVKNALRLGAKRFLLKPYSIEQLGRAVQQALSE